MDPERVEFEARVAFFERSLDTLNEAVLEQNRELARLTERLARLEGKLEEKSGPELGPHDAKPPHY